ncbi:MAG: O-antigen ligase family protein [Elusimicrobia bacterium]|nr:O-antigen ligase family protein [Elusimicrobiota bacterium]
MSAAKTLLKEKVRGCAPAFFLLFACSLSGLRGAMSWEVFALAVFCLAVFFREEGFALPGGLWPWFFGWLGIASVFSLEPLNSLSQFSKYLVFAFFLSLTSQCGKTSVSDSVMGAETGRAPHFGPFGKSAGGPWLLALFGAALICAFVVFYQRLSGAGVYGVSGFNPNYCAAFMAGAFAAAWVFMFSAADGAIGPRQTPHFGPFGKSAGQASVPEKEIRHKMFYGLLSAVFISGIIAANSRGALMASIVAAAAWLITSKKWRVLLYLAAALSLTAALFPEEWLSFLFKAEDPRAYARVWIWGSALEAALARPFFGFGPGLFERAFELFKFPYFNGISYYGHSTIHAHSEVLNLAAEAGLPAAVLFLGAVFYSVKEKSRDAFAAAMKFCALALLVQGTFDIVLYSGAVSLLFFGSLGFAAGGPRHEGACGKSTGRSRPILLIFGVLCVLSLASRVIFERDFSLALRPGADPAQSAAALRRALVFAPYDKDLLLRAARARLLSSGNYAYAAAFVENAAVFCPKDPRFPYLAAEAFIYGANAPAAYSRLDKALVLEPEFLAARVALARLLYSDGKLKAAAAQAAIAEKTASQSRRQYSVYDMLLINFDLEAFKDLKKEIWKKRAVGKNIVSGRPAR